MAKSRVYRDWRFLLVVVTNGVGTFLATLGDALDQRALVLGAILCTTGTTLATVTSVLHPFGGGPAAAAPADTSAPTAPPPTPVTPTPDRSPGRSRGRLLRPVPIVAMAMSLLVLAASVTLLLSGRAERPDQLHGVFGTETAPFFRDPEVTRILRENGIEFDATAKGTGDMVGDPRLARYDFAVAGSELVAGRISGHRAPRRQYPLFSSPLVIATFDGIVDLLRQAHLISTAADGSCALDVLAFLRATARGTRWNELPGNTVYPVNQAIVVRTTHPERSNSAALYTVLTASVLADGLPANADEETIDTVARLFSRQGPLAASTADVFAGYATAGLNYAPLTLVYEAEYAAWAARRTSTQLADRDLVYLAPSIASSHTLLAFTPAGERLGKLLTTDPRLRELAARHGFRTGAAATMTDTIRTRVTSCGTPLPVAPPSAAGQPGYPDFEELLGRVVARLPPI